MDMLHEILTVRDEARRKLGGKIPHGYCAPGRHLLRKKIVFLVCYTF